MEERKTNNRSKPLVSIVIPGYNEEASIVTNLNTICEYMKGLEEKYNWEIIFVNDGSKDKTGELANEFSNSHRFVTVVHHIVNLNLGNALKTGFAHSRGYYIITMDLDLSYSPEHIGSILSTLESAKPDIVVASPYMKGGKVTAVPFMRRVLSKWGNRFMKITAGEKLHTYTGMVRGYRADFIKNVNLKTIDFEINPEILYKAIILRARIIEIPAHLDWTEQNKLGLKRTSGMRIFRAFFSGIMAGFIFRPYIFYITLGLIFFLVATYIITWVFINTFQAMSTLQVDSRFLDDRFSQAIGYVFQMRPHAFFVGGITLVLAIQILSLGFISLQNKRYFEETFNLCSNLLKHAKVGKSGNPENPEK